MAVSFKGAHFPPAVILMGIRWYLAYPLSTRHVEELLQERSVYVNHSTINCWFIKYSPQLEAQFHHRKRRVWVSWRMDETYVRVKGEWVYLYRTINKFSKTIDFLLTNKRDQKAAKRFLTKAIGRNGLPETINIDKSGANAVAIVSYNNEHNTKIYIRKCKFLNNVVEQDHRGVKRITRPMMGFKSFEAAQATLTGIELIRMLRKDQFDGDDMRGLIVAEQFNNNSRLSQRSYATYVGGLSWGVFQSPEIAFGTPFTARSEARRNPLPHWVSVWRELRRA